jgi:hypothetical protein
VDESSPLRSSQLRDQLVLLFLEEWHPFFGQFRRLACKVPLNGLHLSLGVLARVSDLDVIAIVWVFKGGSLKRSWYIVLGLREGGDKRKTFVLVAVEKDLT